MNYTMTKEGAKEPRYGSDGAAGIDIYYNGDEEITIGPGVRVAQMILIPYKRAELKSVESLGETERGTGGFGSTGER